MSKNAMNVSHFRTPERRYAVQTPFKIKNINDLKFSGSYAVAQNLLLKMEKCFLNDSIFRDFYIDFM